MASIKELQEQACAANKEIEHRGLALYTWGNVSVFDRDSGLFAIKPSGVPYSELSPPMFPIIDLDGKRVEGKLNPSSDTPTHAILYKEFAIHDGALMRSIIHTHSTFATAWAQACRSIPVFGTTHADHAPHAIPCTRYPSASEVGGDYEMETGNLIVRTFRNVRDSRLIESTDSTELYNMKPLHPDYVQMIIVAGHGPFAWGKTWNESVYHGVVLEELARIALLTEQLNPGSTNLPNYIREKHFARKHGPNAYYGQKNDNT